jgi:ABC-2 type transport system ATP-binding protein
MMNNPPVLVLDEPTSGLDPLVQQNVKTLLREGADAGNTVFFSSHNLTEVQDLCDRVAILREGKLVAVESVSELRSRAFHKVEATFRDTVRLEEFAIQGVEVKERRDSSLKFVVARDALDKLVKTIAHHDLVDLAVQEATLEDLFLRYYTAAAIPTDEGQ